MDAPQILTPQAPAPQILTEAVMLAARQDDAEQLQRKISNQTSGRIRDLRVEKIDEYLVISGRTSTYYVKQLASQIAMEELTNCELQNTIEVM
ncbi:MAG: hypothetical protein KDA80_12900 [Planctomycetaceae bacterium]|nr:hypothetical protein [Planctomycetaceae bacterium]